MRGLFLFALLAPAVALAQFNQVPLISTSLGGIVSGTNLYARNVSASSLTLSTANVSCTTPLKGTLQYVNQSLQVCDGDNWTSVASFPGTVPTTPGMGGVGYIVLTSATFNGNLGGLTGANTKCYNDLNTYNWMGKPGTLNSSKVKAFLCSKTACNNAVANATYYFANAGDASAGGAFFTTDASGLGPGDNFQWDGSNRFGISAVYWTNRKDDGGEEWWTPAPFHNTNDDTCNNWATSSSDTYGGFGIAASYRSRWIWSWGSCDTAMNLVCLVNP